MQQAEKTISTLQAKAVEDINKLKQQLAALQASSANSIAELQAQLKKKDGMIVDMQKERDRLLAEVNETTRAL